MDRLKMDTVSVKYKDCFMTIDSKGNIVDDYTEALTLGEKLYFLQEAVKIVKAAGTEFADLNPKNVVSLSSIRFEDGDSSVTLGDGEEMDFNGNTDDLLSMAEQVKFFREKYFSKKPEAKKTATKK